MKQVIFRNEARRDVLDAYHWYREKSPQMGRQFRDELDAASVRIRRNPLGYQVLARELRRVLVRGFPYAVLFKSHEEIIVVVAVLHMRRDPAIWQSRT